MKTDDVEDRFSILLQELAREHEGLMQSSRAEIESLRAALRSIQAKPDDFVMKTSDEPSAKVADVQVIIGEKRFDKDGLSSNPSALPTSISIDSMDPTETDHDHVLKGMWTQIPEASGPWHVSMTQILEEVDANIARMNKNCNKSSMRKMSSNVSLGCHSCLRHLPIIEPMNPRHLAWDVLGMIFVVYDMITIPLYLAFQMDDSPIAENMGWITLVFWTIDMILSFFTGFYQDGQLVVDHCKIWKRYFKGWFWIDCIVVVPDWVMKAMGSVANIAGLGRVLRAARIMRTARTLRILKLKDLFNVVYDWIDSEYSFIWMNLVKMLLLVIFLNHIVACCWYLIGRLCKESGAQKNWIEDVGMTPVEGASTSWKYLTSLHWSITQFTPASMDVSATNIPERLFSIMILFWSLVALSSIIGSVSASMTALRNMSSDETKNLWMLRRYLKHKKTPPGLAQRIIEYVEFQQMKAHHSHTVDQDKVKLLANISEQLKLELAHAVNYPILSAHHFFEYLNIHMKPISFRISRNCLTDLACASGDEAFQAGDKADRMYLVSDGSFTYRMANGHALETPFGKQAWASEAAMWTEWRHRGDFVAIVPSSVVAVDSRSFGETVRFHLRAWHCAAQYGGYFVQFMNTMDKNALTDVVGPPFSHSSWQAVLEECDNYSSERSMRDILRQPTKSLSEKSSTKLLDSKDNETSTAKLRL